VRLEVGGEERDETFTVSQRSHAFEVPLPARPTQVIFDPGEVLLKTGKTEKARPLWLRQLAAAKLATDRSQAARALGEQPSPEGTRALRKALETDAFWAVRAAAARALGQVRTPEARDALLAGRADEHPKVRRAVAAALGEFRDDALAGEALATWAGDGDPSCFVEGAAALALGRTRSPLAVTVLPRLLARDAFQDVIRVRALEGLGATGDEAALPVARAAYTAATSFQARRAAVAAVARLAEGTLQARGTRELLETYLQDPDFRVRTEAAAGLVLLQDGRAVGALEGALRGELDGRAKRRFREAIADLQERGRPAEQARKLGEEVERLRGEVLKLRERLDKIEARPEAGSGGGGKPASGSPARRRRPPSRRGAKASRRGR
jgi:aminopeptidase N